MPLEKALLRNRLLSLLSDEDFDVLAPHLAPVDLPKGFMISKAHQPITHYYFIDVGIASVVATSPEGLQAEVGLAGRDGIVPIAAILAVDQSPHDVFIQVEGFGHAIEAGVLLDILARNAAIRALFLRFVQTLWTQATYTALSNAVHHIEERLARWILMCHDRVDDGKIALTHEFMAIMLAVRRPSVTTALHVLEGNHLIYSGRGLITIRDRQALENFALDAYGAPEREYARLIGPMKG